MFDFGVTVDLILRKHWLSVRVVPRQGEAVQVEGIAQAAMRRTGKRSSSAVGIGEEAAAFTHTQDVTIINAFCHPRVMIGGFDNALVVVREFLRRASGTKKSLSQFRLVIYVPDNLDGGLTDIEERALIELGMRLGASATFVQPQPANPNDTLVL